MQMTDAPSMQATWFSITYLHHLVARGLTYAAQSGHDPASRVIVEAVHVHDRMRPAHRPFDDDSKWIARPQLAFGVERWGWQKGVVH
jgi:hypothetical protein